ncbi:MAG: hypothetical protein H6953_14970 [Chromatiaceae bacterium]|nr:hypothetical protein [Chromatiaceae bacterium]MCP5421754.1 hypothetical protein [Chromatiaceae bacterium]
MEIFLSFLAGSGIAIAAAAFLSKRLINQLLAKELEKYKSQLSAKTETLKSNLAIFAHEQNVATSRADSQKAEAIHNVYAALRGIISPASRISAGCPLVGGDDEDDLNYYHTHAEAAHEGGHQLSITLADNAIYFSGATYTRIAELAAKVHRLNASFLRPIRQGVAEYTDSATLLARVIDEQKAYEEKYDSEILPEMQALTDLFRIELGIEKLNK